MILQLCNGNKNLIIKSTRLRISDHNIKMSLKIATKLEVLNKIVDKIQRKDEIEQYNIYNTLFEKTFELIKSMKLVIYGGFALNMLLPQVHKIYKYKSLPDIDVFSSSAKSDAMKISNALTQMGYKYVEVRAGVHKGTYKIYVEFQAIVDVTNVSKSLFTYLMRESIEKNGFNICPSEFLMWSLYKELARPQGSGFRWEKVFKRYIIFHRQYKFKGVHPQIPWVSKFPEDSKLILSLKQIIKSEKLLLTGICGANMYLGLELSVPFDILCEDIDKTFELINNKMDNVLTLSKHPRRQLYEISSNTGYIKHNNNVVCRLYETDACYSYTKFNGYTVGSIDTILCFLYAKYISCNNFKSDCTAMYKYYIYELEVYASNMIIEERFKTKCQGYETTVSDVRKVNWNNRVFRYRPIVPRKSKSPPYKDQSKTNNKKSKEI